MRIALLPLILLSAIGFAQAFDPSTQDDSRSLARQFKPVPEPVGPALSGEFKPIDDETISLMGGATVYQMQRHGYFEAALQGAFPQRGLKVRNLGWAADTVFLQQRPMYFYTEKGDSREGSVPDQREKIDPGTFLMVFGKMESLGGEAALADFEEAYDGLLAALSPYSKRLILVAPVPFPESGPAAALAVGRNEVLAKYVARIESLASSHGALFVPMDPMPEDCFDRAGMYLSDAGQREFASRLASALGFPFSPSEDLLAAVREKNHLWDQYYRPTNWAFLYGDRQHVPSSRDHRDANRRWFEEELRKLPDMIASVEERIQETAGEVKP